MRVNLKYYDNKFRILQGRKWKYGEKVLISSVPLEDRYQQHNEAGGELCQVQ